MRRSAREPTTARWTAQIGQPPGVARPQDGEHGRTGHEQERVLVDVGQEKRGDNADEGGCQDPGRRQDQVELGEMGGIRTVFRQSAVHCSCQDGE